MNITQTNTKGAPLTPYVLSERLCGISTTNIMKVRLF